MKKVKIGYRTGEKALTKKEYDKVISVVQFLKDEVMVKLAVATGARREDLVNMKWEDVEERNNLIKFYEAKKKRIHTVYVPDDLIMLLKKYQNTLHKVKDKRILGIAGRTAYNRFQTLCKQAGIPSRPFHALRATCIKFCQANGWSAEEVSKHTGDTIEVIQRHYSTPSNAEMKDRALSKPII